MILLNPRIEIDLMKIEENSRLLHKICQEYGIEKLTGVNKVCCADIEVAKAMLRGGIEMLGDSRLENLQKIREAKIEVPLLLLRLPMLSQVEKIVQYADCSLNSQVEVIEALSRAAQKNGRIHKIILMIDLGDLREGVRPERVLSVIEKIKDLSGIRLVGIGTNLTCYGGVIPTVENLTLLIELAKKIEEKYQLTLEIISGGNSSSLQILQEGKMPQGINHLRLGESILLGRETIARNIIPGLYSDAFTIYAEIIEIEKKPSVPLGIIGQDTFGNSPVFIDIGEHWRAIVALGRQDVIVEGLQPLDSRIKIIGASSDHLILDVNACAQELEVGKEIAFLPSYGALLLAMTSPYINKVYRNN